MKRIISFICIFLIGHMLYSQVLIALLLGDKLNTGKIEFGLDGGVSYSYIGNMDANRWDRNWNLGFYFDIRMKNQWYLSTGVLVKSTLGIDELTEKDLEFLEATTYDYDGKYSQKISYFIVPALAKYKFDNHLYAEIGPQFGLMHKANIEFDSDVDGIDINGKEDNKDQIKRIDMGLTAGVGYRLLKGLGWTIGLRYYYGFIDVYKDRSGTKNKALFLRVNVPIGLSQEKKDEIKNMKETKKEKKKNQKEAKKEEKEKEKEKEKENSSK